MVWNSFSLELHLLPLSLSEAFYRGARELFFVVVLLLLMMMMMTGPPLSTSLEELPYKFSNE